MMMHESRGKYTKRIYRKIHVVDQEGCMIPPRIVSRRGWWWWGRSRSSAITEEFKNGE